ncbi:MAG: peptide/nickel transport system permease protein [Thermomicrobiales bacterium]|jgi:peptide/nickel transport system permease protein|nr:peptide/nickel transport system permease protein [Thermomicrobiales bacterium]
MVGAAAIVIAIAMIGIAIAAPVLSPHSPTAQSLTQRLKPPTLEHPFGTDGLGRDVLSRVMWGGRVSLTVGICAALLTVALGAVIGSIAGFFGPLADQLVMRVTDVVMAIPSVLLILLIVAIFGEGLLLTVIAIGAVSWPGTARLLRAEFLRLRTLEFVDASRVSGASAFRIVTRHLFPNAAAPLIVQSSLLIAESILIESGLSYLGLGVQPPTPSWGNMLFEGRRFIDVAWWISTWPGVAIFLMVISLNLAGDVVRDALDPRTRRSR